MKTALRAFILMAGPAAIATAQDSWQLTASMRRTRALNTARTSHTATYSEPPGAALTDD